MGGVRLIAILGLATGLVSCGSSGLSTATIPVVEPTSSTTPVAEPTTNSTSSTHVETASTDPVGPSVTVPAVGETYTVLSGDAVLRIARRYCVDPNALASANGWTDGIQHPIYVGDVIRIPSEGICPVDPSPDTVAASTSTDTPVDAVSQLAADLVGRWEGPATVPSGWVELNDVWITFEPDGTYESGVEDTANPSALYYGITCDCSSNRYSVVTLNSDGSADLDVDISWDEAGNTTRGLFHRLTISGDTLSFEFFPSWLGMIGPITYELHRGQ